MKFLLSSITLTFLLIACTPKKPVLKDYGQALAFTSINQNGVILNEKSFIGKVQCINFFFIHCQGVCPAMNSKVYEVQQEFLGNEDLKFISHTLDPTNDDMNALKDYAINFEADTTQWHFVREKQTSDVYTLSKEGYFLTADRDLSKDPTKDDTAIDHTGRVVLIDKKGIIRGYYNMLESQSVTNLKNAITFLLEE